MTLTADRRDLLPAAPEAILALLALELALLLRSGRCGSRASAQ